MQTIYIHISSLVGLFVFLTQMMRFTPLDRTILTGVSSALGVYVVLTFAGVFVRRIVAQREVAADGKQRSDNQKATAGEREPAPTS